jgi:hypothetical protein
MPCAINPPYLAVCACLAYYMCLLYRLLHMCCFWSPCMQILSTSTFFLPANLHDQLIPTHQEELSGRLGPNTYARWGEQHGDSVTQMLICV